MSNGAPPLEAIRSINLANVAKKLNLPKSAVYEGVKNFKEIATNLTEANISQMGNDAATKIFIESTLNTLMPNADAETRKEILNLSKNDVRKLIPDVKKEFVQKGGGFLEDEHGRSLPPGWEMYRDREQNRWYYRNRELGISQWDPPLLAAPASAASSAPPSSSP